MDHPEAPVLLQCQQSHFECLGTKISQGFKRLRFCTSLMLSGFNGKKGQIMHMMKFLFINALSLRSQTQTPGWYEQA